MAAMELATRTCGFMPSASTFTASTSGRKTPLQFTTAFAASTSVRKTPSQFMTASFGCVYSPSSWRLLMQKSVAGRFTRPLIVAANKPEKSASESKTPSAADAKNSIEKPPVLSDGQSVNNEISKKVSDSVVTREQVLKACVNTSAALAATGLAIRQATHWAVESNWTGPDCYVGMPYTFEVWHLGATAGTVVLVASLRQTLLSSWPEFSQSSRQSNDQVLSPLKLNDYLVVSFLPGISEELLFRGAILPLVGVDWRGVVVAGLVFGVLHISGGRNAAFAAWASFVGVVYGFAAISTTNLAVPMIAHSVANLVAAYVWRIEEDANVKSK